MSQNNSDLTSTDLLQILDRQKWIIIQAMLVVLALAGFFLYRATPIYRASATLLARTDDPQISPREELPLVAQALKLDGGRPVETQKRLVKSWPVVAEALRRTGIRVSPEEVLRRLRVSTFKDMDVIEIAYEDADPKTAARLANEIASSYISRSQLAARESAANAKKFVKAQLDTVRRELALAENRLREFKNSHRIASLSEETKAQIAALSDLRAAAEEAKASIEPAHARVRKLQQLLDDQPERHIDSIVTERNPLIDKLAEEVADLETRQAGLLAEVTEENPAAKNLAKQIATAREKLARESARVLASEESLLNPVRQTLLERLCEARAESIVAEKKARGLSALVREREAELKRLPDEELALARLERDVNTAERLHTGLVQKYEEFRLAEAMRLAPARLVEPAVEPMRPVKPRKPLVLSIALMMGLMLGLALASLRDRIDDSLRTSEQIESMTGLPVLGRVPDTGKDPPVLINIGGSRSAVAESYRILRANLTFSSVDSDVRTLLVTSALAGEGKTTIALNLAAAAAAEGKKVVLVEADLRRPMLQARTTARPTGGLTDVLVGQIELENAIVRSTCDGLDLIVCGKTPPNPTELLASNRMRQVLEELKRRYDLVIIDSPPLCPLADAAHLASIADATLLITAQGITRRLALEHSLDLLENARARIVGIVINRVKRSGSAYRRGYYYSYHYYYGSRNDSGGRGRATRDRAGSNGSKSKGDENRSVEVGS